MKIRQKIPVLSIVTAVAILLAIAAELVYFSDSEYRYRTRRFNALLAEKEKIMESCLNSIRSVILGVEGQISETQINNSALAEQHKITILEYKENNLVYWSDNTIDVPELPDDSIFVKPILFIQNGWYIPEMVKAGDEKIIGLLRVYTDYGFENDLIRNGFEKDFRLPVNTRFSFDKEESEFHVHTRDGTFLFTLVFSINRTTTGFIIIPLLMWIISFVLLVLLVLEIAGRLVSRGKENLAAGFCFVVFAMVYLVILLTGKPLSFYVTALFSPYGFTLNKFIPSLGHLLIISILLAVFSWVFLRYTSFKPWLSGNRLKDYFLLLVLLLPVALVFILYQAIFSSLIVNSNINFETYRALELNLLSAVGYATMILLFFVPVSFLMKIFRTMNQRGFRTVLFATGTLLLVFLAGSLFYPRLLIPSVLLFTITTTGVWITQKRSTGVFNIAVIFSMVLGLWSLYLITILSEQKTTENLKIQAVTYSTENDPEAEYSLLDIWPEISGDEILAGMMTVEYFGRDDFNKITDYLHDTYFDGYLGNYNFNIVPCRNDENLRIGETNEIYRNCFDFFNERIDTNGHLITGTGFYFIDNQRGRAYYLGKLLYQVSENITNGLFIELYSDINVFQPGYSELLLDKRYHGYARLRDYSFAKYINEEMVLRTGEFPYNKTDANYVDRTADFRQFKHQDFRHILYINGNVTVIISRPFLTPGDMIISFAYLFTFTFLFTSLVLFLIRRPSLRSLYSFNFRQKLQLSFIGVLLFSFILVGIVITSLNIRQYQAKHYENIREKMNSVYMEMDTRISMEKELIPGWSSNTYASLNEFLIRLSNIFNTDINLYDLSGYLLATSRPEIFYRNLTSRRMNNTAFLNLKSLSRTEYLQRETIGNLQYISAYIPFYNTDNELLVYLNLPYFRMQSVLSKEISNLIVTVINFTLLLIVIAMGLAVFISSRLTSPLNMLSSGLASVELGKKSEHLSYVGNDEIGELVRQYNRMLDELEDSARKLTASEREYAWREMARQIAHEIKNPLTPMKLNIQQLLKSWKDGVPGFEKKLERFTKNQIEYIDNLSSIASAFSSFAKMPDVKPVEVDLLEQVKTTLELFKSSGNITFRLGWPHDKRIFIYADREQLNGVFSNLIKNGIQSIPHGREGIIRVNIELKRDKVLVSVADNGSGIPDSLHDKMFTPNFTTKSSGMGLGLSIVRRYVESASGRIWFESEADKGSVFYIEYPLLYAAENQGGHSAVD